MERERENAREMVGESDNFGTIKKETKSCCENIIHSDSCNSGLM
jgi:hypothetical protein